MKIYTKTGDRGETSLLGGKRVAKSHYRIEAYGTVDELNAYIGLVKDSPANAGRKALLKNIQDRLFTIGAVMASVPDKKNIQRPDLEAKDIEELEEAIDEMEKTLPALKNFVLPGGAQEVSFVHLARMVCRRAERCAVALDTQEGLDALVVGYLNRLSDYLFVLGRKLCQELEVEEVTWQPRSKSE